MEMKITIVICIVSAAAVLILSGILVFTRKRDKKGTPHSNDSIARYMIKTALDSTVRIGKIHEVGKRKDQQDTLAYSDVEDESVIHQKGMLLIVADGIGGLKDGAEVSSLAAVEMLRYFDGHNMLDRPADALKEALLYANEKVNVFLGEERIGKCGSTLAAAMMQDHNVYWISVGDSSIFLYRENRLRRLNVLHNYEAELKKKIALGELTRAEAAREPRKAALTRFIGQGDIALIDRNTEPLALTSGDRLMLATDGVYESVSMTELEGFLHSGAGEAAQGLQHLIETKDRRNQDNYTAIIVEIMTDQKDRGANDKNGEIHGHRRQKNK